MVSRRNGTEYNGAITPHAVVLMPEWLEALSPKVWLPDNSITGVADGGTVASWPDWSGNAVTPVQATEGNKPLSRATGGPNGRACIEFDGLADHLRKTSVTWNQPAHVFLVAKFMTAPGANETLVDGGVANSIRIFADTGKYAIYAGGAEIVRTVQNLDTNWHLLECKFDGTSSSIKLDNNTAVVGNAGTNNPSGLILGLAGDVGTGPCDCRIAEVIGFASILSAGNTTTVRSNLQTKYAL
jgi:hypothetical protein